MRSLNWIAITACLVLASVSVAQADKADAKKPRLFNSKLTLDVIADPQWWWSGVDYVTPAPADIEIPPDAEWGVRPAGHATLQQTIAEVNRLDVPSLVLPAEVEDDDLKTLARLRDLRTLAIVDCTRLTPAGIAHVRAARSLEYVVIGKALAVTPEVLNHLAVLPKLKRLQFRSVTVDGEGFKHLDQLEAIELFYTTGSGLQHLNKLTNLRRISISATGEIPWQAFDNLKQLRVVELSHVDDEGLRHLSKLPRLEQLRISNASKVTLAGVAHLSNAKKLRHLVLKRPTQFSNSPEADTAVRQIAQLKQLQELDLNNIDLSVDGAKALTHLPKLKTLTLSTTRLTREEIEALPAIESLHLTRPVTRQLLPALFKLNNLERLTIDDPELVDEDLAGIAKLTNLQILYLRNLNISNGGLRHIAKLKDLTGLSVSACPNITDAGLATLDNLGKLTYLGLSQLKITGDGLKFLKHTRDLDTLILRGNGTFAGKSLAHIGHLDRLKFVGLNGSPIVDEDLRHLRDLKRLDVLHIMRTRVTGPGLAHLRKLQGLRILIWSNEQPANVDISHVAALKGIRNLKITGNWLWDDNLAKAEPLPALRIAMLRYCGFKAPVLKWLAKSPRLRKLDVSRSSITNDLLPIVSKIGALKSLQLADTRVNDNGLPHISRMKDLTSLDLRDTFITDRGLPHLRNLQSLKYLYLDDEWISPKAKRELFEHLGIPLPD